MAQSVLSLSYRLDRPGFESRQEGEIDVFCKTFRLGPTQPPIQGVPQALFPGYRDRSMRRTAHLHLVPNLKMNGALPTLPLPAFIACIGSACLVTLSHTFAVTLVPFIDSVLQVTLMFRRSLCHSLQHICTYFHIFYCICLLFAHRH